MVSKGAKYLVFAFFLPKPSLGVLTSRGGLSEVWRVEKGEGLVHVKDGNQEKIRK